MATDYDGNSLSVNDKVWIPATVTSVGATTINVQTAYGNHTINGVQGDATRKPRAFPDAP